MMYQKITTLLGVFQWSCWFAYQSDDERHIISHISCNGLNAVMVRPNTPWCDTIHPSLSATCWCSFQSDRQK